MISGSKVSKAADDDANDQDFSSLSSMNTSFGAVCHSGLRSLHVGCLSHAVRNEMLFCQNLTKNFASIEIFLYSIALSSKLYLSYLAGTYFLALHQLSLAVGCSHCCEMQTVRDPWHLYSAQKKLSLKKAHHSLKLTANVDDSPILTIADVSDTSDVNFTTTVSAVTTTTGAV